MTFTNDGTKRSVTSRAACAARIIEAACTLVSGCKELVVEQTIICRATQMLGAVWQFEITSAKQQPELPLVKEVMVEIQEPGALFSAQTEKVQPFVHTFWEAVTFFLDNKVVYNFTACYDESVNPHGGYNVHITVQPVNAAVFVFDLLCV